MALDVGLKRLDLLRQPLQTRFNLLRKSSEVLLQLLKRSLHVLLQLREPGIELGETLSGRILSSAEQAAEQPDDATDGDADRTETSSSERTRQRRPRDRHHFLGGVDRTLIHSEGSP